MYNSDRLCDVVAPSTIIIMRMRDDRVVAMQSLRLTMIIGLDRITVQSQERLL